MPRAASSRAADAGRAAAQLTPGGARMTVRMLRWVTGCVAAVSVGLLVGGIALSYVDRHMGPLSRWDFPNVFEEASFIAVPVVGFVLASRRPGNRVGWIFLGTGLVVGLAFFADRYSRGGLVFTLTGAAAIAVRYARSSGEERLQLKWIVAVGLLVVVAAIPFAFVPQLALSPAAESAAVSAVKLVFSLALVCLFAAIAVAVLKYRLYDIDRVISRTLAYAIITGVLAGVYAGLVLLATGVFGVHTPVAVAAATLAAAALFSPVRRRVQRRVDRRFNRARYDADRAVAAFAAQLKDAVDLDTVCADLARAVHTALEPAHVSVWTSRRE
jgi:hypothetical protein